MLTDWTVISADHDLSLKCSYGKNRIVVTWHKVPELNVRNEQHQICFGLMDGICLLPPAG
jgi:hypothetical protein